MGLLDDQIKQRKISDDEALSSAYMKMAGAILGRKIISSMADPDLIIQAAIAEVLKYYQINADEVPEEVDDLNDTLEYMLRPHGIVFRGVRLTKGWQNEAVGPMLGTLKDSQRIVALIPRKIMGYYYLDTTTGKKVNVTRKTAQLFEEEGIAFYTTFPQRAITLLDMMKYVWSQKNVFDGALMLTAYALITAVGMLMPKLNNILLSDVIDSESLSMLAGIASFMICVSISSTLIGIWQTLINSRIKTKSDMAVESATMLRIMSLKPSFFRDYSAGELSSLQSYFGSLTGMINSIITTGGLSSIFSLAYVGQIFKYAPGLVGPSMIIMLATVILSLLVSFMQMNVSQKQMKRGTKNSGISYSLISGIQKIKLAGAEKRAFAKWGESYAKSADLQYNPPFILKISGVLSTALSLLGTIIMYSVAIKTKVTPSDYYSFTTAYGMVSGAFLSLASCVSSVSRIKPILNIVKPLMDAVPETESQKNMVTKVRGGIEINNVSFSYSENSPKIIDDLSVKINPGQYVAIVGKTGCGKSTLIRLLLGFEKPQSGSIFYDNKDIETLDLKSLRRKIGIVLQDGKLMQGDLFSNITLSAPWLSMDDAWEAAEMAGIAEDIRNMPMGMFTIVSEGSGGISGGQRQRIMIARAVAPKPKILIFDEATSALDNITQKQVSEALDNLKCTRLVIAHRLSTIVHCDRILVLDGGKIIEDGTYDELIAKNGFFADLVARQRLDQDAE